MNQDTGRGMVEGYEEFARVSEYSKDAIIIIDESGRTIHWNRSAEIFFGYTREEAIGQDLHGLIAPARYHAAFRKGFAGFLKNGKGAAIGKTLELIGRRKDGTEFPVELSLSKLTSRGRLHAIGIIRNISQRKDLEKRLIHEKNLANSYLDLAGAMIVHLDTEGKITLANRMANEVLGYEMGELEGKNWFETCLPPHLREPVKEIFKRIVQGEMKGTRRYENAVMTKEGGTKIIAWHNTILRDDDDRVIGVLSAGNDVSAQRRATENLLRAKEAAVAASRAKSAFLANMSHEIRTPMNGVLGMADLLADTRLTEEQGEMVETIISSGKNLLAVINSILDVSKIEAGELAMEAIPFDLEEVVSETLKTLAVFAHEKNLELVEWIDNTLPRGVVGDPTRLRQVITNLVGNAIKFTEEGEIVVRVEVEEVTNRVVDLSLSVQDTGIGMPGDVKDEIFEPFTQADSSTTRRFGGTGLGLSITRGIVEAMGGRIEVESEEGSGTAFHIHLTMERAELPESKPCEPASLTGIKALVVDDNAINRNVCASYLTAWGMEVATAASGETALALLGDAFNRKERFSIVLLDAHMPGIDGFAVAERIRRHVDLEKTTIMMLTSNNRVSEIRRSRELGLAAYLVKPIARKELLRTLCRSLNDHPIISHLSSSDAIILPSAPPMRILVAEDNAVNRRLIEKLLEKKGHSVTLAENGIDAVKAVKEEAFDLILMDVQMPKMDGITAARIIRQEDSGIPIIALTAHALSEDRERCIAAGMNDYLSKPIDRKALAALLAKYAPKERRRERVVKKDVETHFSRSDFLERVGGDEELASDLIGIFLEEAGPMLTDLKEAVTAGNLEEAVRAAHALKGALGNLSATKGFTLAGEAEDSARRGDAAALAGTVSALEAEMAILMQILKRGEVAA